MDLFRINNIVFFFLVSSTAEEEKVIPVQAKNLEKFKKINKVQDKKSIKKSKNVIERQQNEIKKENSSSETTLVSIIRKVLGKDSVNKAIFRFI